MTATSVVSCQLLLTGTAVVMTGEACSQDSGLIYKITTAAHRIIDPATALVVKENGSSSSQVSSVDFLRGRITFSGTPSTPVTVDGAYLPATNFTNATGFSLNVTGNLLDTTYFDSNVATRLRSVQGLKDVSGELMCNNELRVAVDSGGARLLITDINSFNAFVIKFYTGGTTDFWIRAVLDSATVDGAVDALIKGKIPFKMSPTLGTGTHGAAYYAAFSYGAT